jgi:hypothetical protein
MTTEVTGSEPPVQCPPLRSGSCHTHPVADLITPLIMLVGIPIMFLYLHRGKIWVWPMALIVIAGLIGSLIALLGSLAAGAYWYSPIGLAGSCFFAVLLRNLWKNHHSRRNRRHTGQEP